MLQTERERTILDLLTQAGSARIKDLSVALGVSEETVRRSLKRLEVMGRLTRVHGGAQLRDWGAEPSFALRLGVNIDAKRRIAARLAGLIDDGASLFLDVGSTTAFVAQALRDHRDLLVVTNSLSVAQTLAGRGGNRVFMAGGELRPHDGGAFGAEALAFVRQFRVRHAILSAVALDGRTGFMLNDLREAEFSRAIIDCAEVATIAADATKFGQTAPVRITDPDAFHRLVTDATPEGPLADLLDRAGIEIILA
jgi:DeoR family transcriptional regulator, glycerol-3-phosphate regulon repressor